MTYWHTYTGLEVDDVIGDARIAIEIKSVEDVLPRHLKGLKVFAEGYPECNEVFEHRVVYRIGNVDFVDGSCDL